MAEILNLVQPQPDPSIVSLLEDMLEAAKAGRIVAIAGVTMEQEGAFGEFFSSTALEREPIQFLGYLRVLQMRFERQIPLE